MLLQGGWDAAGVYQPGWSAYAAFFDRVAMKLTGCSSGSSSGGDKMIIGPGWDNVSQRMHMRYNATDLVPNGSEHA